MFLEFTFLEVDTEGARSLVVLYEAFVIETCRCVSYFIATFITDVTFL